MEYHILIVLLSSTICIMCNVLQYFWITPKILEINLQIASNFIMFDCIRAINNALNQQLMFIMTSINFVFLSSVIMKGVIFTKDIIFTGRNLGDSLACMQNVFRFHK